MTKFIPAVIAFESGGDYIHWFDWVVIEYPDNYADKQVRAAVARIAAEDVLEDTEEEGWAVTEETYGKVEAKLASYGILGVKVHETAGMAYLAVLEDWC